jgi:hypothetical protein
MDTQFYGLAKQNRRKCSWWRFSVSSPLRYRSDFELFPTYYLCSWQSFNHRSILKYFQLISTMDSLSIISNFGIFSGLLFQQWTSLILEYSTTDYPWSKLTSCVHSVWEIVSHVAYWQLSRIQRPTPSQARMTLARYAAVQGPLSTYRPIDRALNRGWRQHNPGFRRYMNAVRLESTLI